MLYTLVVVLLIVWLLGGIPGHALYDIGPMVHLILVVALILLVVQFLTGRRRL